MANPYPSFAQGMARERGGSAVGAFSITPSNTVPLANPTSGIYVGVGGDLAVEMLDGSTVTFVGVADASWLPIRVSKVLSTGTGAASLVGLV